MARWSALAVLAILSYPILHKKILGTWLRMEIYPFILSGLKCYHLYTLHTIHDGVLNYRPTQHANIIALLFNKILLAMQDVKGVTFIIHWVLFVAM